MSNQKFVLPTGACHAILLGMLDPQTIVSVQENQEVEDSWGPGTDKFLREANLTFDSLLQQL